MCAQKPVACKRILHHFDNKVVDAARPPSPVIPIDRIPKNFVDNVHRTVAAYFIITKFHTRLNSSASSEKKKMLCSIND